MMEKSMEAEATIAHSRPVRKYFLKEAPGSAFQKYNPDHMKPQR